MFLKFFSFSFFLCVFFVFVFAFVREFCFQRIVALCPSWATLGRDFLDSGFSEATRTSWVRRGVGA